MPCDIGAGSRNADRAIAKPRELGFFSEVEGFLYFRFTLCSVVSSPRCIFYSSRLVVDWISNHIQEVMFYKRKKSPIGMWGI